MRSPSFFFVEAGTFIHNVNYKTYDFLFKYVLLNLLFRFKNTGKEAWAVFLARSHVFYVPPTEKELGFI